MLVTCHRNLPILKSTTTVYNRSRAKNKRSIEAKNHLGRGLFCCKKPPKSEERSNLLTHYCRAFKKNVIRSLCSEDDHSSTLVRSYDDKAYLCPETSTGENTFKCYYDNTYCSLYIVLNYQVNLYLLSGK